MLTIRLLGSPQVLVDERALEVARRKSRALTYYLAAQDRPVQREHLLALFWPDLERPAAQQTLRVVLHGLRQTLGRWLVSDASTLGLAPDVQVDARVFRSRLSTASADADLLASALDLYRGDFLEGFCLPDAPAYDDWVAAERERYRRLAARGLTALAEERERRGELIAALESLDRALAFDPLQEDLQRAAIRLHYLAGDRTSAIRRYERLRRLLDEEMGVPPMAETRALYDAIVADEPPLPAVRAAAAGPLAGRRQEALAPVREPSVDEALPFVGREDELRALRDLAAGGSRRLVLVEGEPGLGKTRLVEEFIRESGALPVVGAAHELEQALPYQPIVEALRGLLARPDWPTLSAALRAGLPPVWLAEAARLVPELAGPALGSLAQSGAPDEWRLWEGLSQCLLALARQRPTVVFVDDLHWADASTLGVLGYLVRQAGAAPLVFLAAAQASPPRSPLGALLQALTREGRLTRLTLSRLNAGDVTALARRLSSTYAYPLADWLARTSEGNPYILTELVRHARERRLLTPDGAVNLSALSASPVVPRSVYSLIASRLERLSEAARRVLDAAVAVGREFEFEVACRTAGVSEATALDALDELRAAGLVRPLAGSLYAFDHSLTMEVAYREVGEPRHRLLHRRAAEALENVHRERLDQLAGLIAWHYAEGNAPERAAPYAIRAGQQAARIAAWAEAIRFYEQALAGTAPAERGPALMALGDARFRAGQSVQASEAFREALALAESRGDAPAGDAARLALARAYLPQARYAEATALARQVRAGGRSEGAVSAEFVWGTALSLEGADLAEAREHLRAAEALCGERDSAGSVLLSQIRFELGSVAAQRGDLQEAIDLYRGALTAARRAEDQGAALPQVVLAHNNLAYHLRLLEDPAAREHAQEGLSLSREEGLLGLQPYLLSTLGEIALADGDLEAAEARFAEGLAIAERLSIPERIAGLTANLGLVADRRGETALAIHRLSTALARADTLGTRHLAAQVRLWLAPLLPPAEGRARLAEARAIAETGGRRRLLEEIARLEAGLPEM